MITESRMPNKCGALRSDSEFVVPLILFAGTTPQFWTNLQANYELELAEDARGAEIAEHIRPHDTA
jgi:plasmid maintenance system antidote protein VapI